jgi:hypothetical protein
MAEIRHFPQAGFQATWENVARNVAPPGHPALSAEQYCVYNQTRARFVATGVDAVEAFSGGQEERLRSLEPGTGAGLWILPCPEISPTSIRLPLDLVYLNNEGGVLAVIESFPLGGPAVSSAIAASMLALPENTVAEGELHVGDRLIISVPGEMKRHLRSIKEAKAEAQESPSSFLEPFLRTPAQEPGAVSTEDPASSFTQPAPLAADPAPAMPPQAAPSVFAPAPAAPVEAAQVKAEIAGARTPATEAPAPPPQTKTQPWKKKADSGNWFTRLLRVDPVDPRNTSRQLLPGLIAYFFTGGTPVGHPVRDVSPTGMFIVTDERWYPGTVVRVTLTDRHNPTAERSITVNAKAVRWGSDGVGLEFVLDDTNRGKRLNAGRMERANGMDPEEIEEFLRIFNSRLPQR